VDLPGYGKSKINHALMVGGIPYQLRVTEDFLDIEIDHYLLMDFEAFQTIVDSLGGVTVDVPEDLVKHGEQQFAKGAQHFDGTTALKYARFRSEPDGDLGRVERQWGILGGIAEKMDGKDLVGKINELLPAVEDHMRTDLTPADITTIAKTYGANCTSPKAADISMMRGTRVKLHDPILDQAAYFNVLEATEVNEYVDAFRGDGLESQGDAATSVVTSDAKPATPASSASEGTATPIASPEGTPLLKNADPKKVET
jgi:LCP family protein required for cell wall assembly